MAMAVAELFALKEQLAKTSEGSGKDGQSPHPGRRSLANTMRAIRSCLRAPDSIPRAGSDLPALLRKAITDGYRRRKPKRARYRPPNPDKKPLGAPKVRKINAKEKKRLSEIAEELAV
jgi:hypothetical protein